VAGGLRWADSLHTFGRQIEAHKQTQLRGAALQRMLHVLDAGLFRRSVAWIVLSIPAHVHATRPPRARMRFIVWTINDSSDLCALVGADVDGIMTDDPGHLRAIIQLWGQPGHCPLLHSESMGSQAGAEGALP